LKGVLTRLRHKSTEQCRNFAARMLEMARGIAEVNMLETVLCRFVWV
jgi:hypothetical protein